MLISPHEHFRRASLTGALEIMCEELELSPTQAKDAKTHYEASGGWLADSTHPALQGISIYVQGSTAIGTTVKPIGRAEHDVDLIARLTMSARGYSPVVVKKLVGDRLKEHLTYERLLVEMCRCWRLDYASKFHLDITPSIPNIHCPYGGELVPDKELSAWKASNPRGYKALFDKRAALAPRFRLSKSAFAADESSRASVEPYPEAMGFKGILRRAVQIVKRHRDVHFSRRPNECAPISVIVTTLLSRSYERCVTQRVYDDELDVLTDVIAGMPEFIDFDANIWSIENETTVGENFAEKWNAHPDRAASFFAWHRKLLEDVSTLRSIEGLDRIARRLDDSFGERPAEIAIAHIEDAISKSRASGTLRYGTAGLVTATATTPPAASAAVARNTFFGR